MEQSNRHVIGRRRLGAAMAVAMIAAVGAWSIHAAAPARHPDVMLLYVGAEDCAPCRVWQRGDGASFLASPEASLIRFREVKSPRLTDLMNDDNWPADLRDYRNHLKRSDGVPLWMVISGDQIVERQFGGAAWRESILPKLRSLHRS